MRTSIILLMLPMLGGCDSLGEIIREKKYTLQIHETPNTRQTFGYNDDYDYVGFMVHGRFGATIYKHEHNASCSHEVAVAASAGN